MNGVDEIRPPWTATLTDGEHMLMLFAVLAVVLALVATLVRVRFASAEVHGEFRTASLTANAVVAIALLSYVLVLVAFLVGYRATPAGWEPTGLARYAWAVRYVDWAVTVPLLVVELLAVSTTSSTARKTLLRRVGMSLAFVMVLLGFLGAFVVQDGRSFTALLGFGVASSLCFLGLAVLIVTVALHSLPRIIEGARASYRSGVVLLLVVWFAYPIVYGLQGTTSGGAWAVAGVAVLSVADVIAKIGFSSQIHRTAVFQSRAEEDASPSTQRRPRQPEADTLWVEGSTRFERDADDAERA